MKLAAVVVGATAIAAAPLHQVSKEAALEPFPTLEGTPLEKPAPMKKNVATRTKRNRKRGGLESLTEPFVVGVVSPLATGLGRGVAGAASGTQRFADLLGDAIATLTHVLSGVSANAEQGGVAAANAAPAVQGTVHAIDENGGIAGDVVRTLTGGS